MTKMVLLDGLKQTLAIEAGKKFQFSRKGGAL